MLSKRLTLPAPRRNSVATENGFVEVPWDEFAVDFAISGGAWFCPGKHEFETKAVASYAYEKSLFHQLLEEYSA